MVVSTQGEDNGWIRHVSNLAHEIIGYHSSELLD